MKEKIKTTTLIVLVALSLLQSYLLAYSMPGLGATVRSDQDYVNTEPMGTATSVESVIFPETLVIHLGGNKHTIIYPGTQFYDMILNQRIQGREFKGFQRSPSDVLNWEEIRKNDIGIELRFENGIPVELLQKLLKLEGDLLFLNETIDRIWIFKTTGTEEIRTFFFSSDGEMVYESVRADLTVRDVQDYVGFGQYQPKYTMTADGLYVPAVPIQSTEMLFPYETYSPDLMQRSMFDPSTTRALEDRGGSQIYTDGKRGLQVEQNGKWINYTDPSAPQITENLLSDNVYASVDFVNQHGGWDGVHRFVNALPGGEGKAIRFKQYVEQYPVLAASPFHYGYMKLTLQQGVVTEYARSLITLAADSESRTVRWLPGGEELQSILNRYDRRSEVKTLFPALQALPLDEERLRFNPIWAVRLADGTEEMLTDAYPSGYEPPKQVVESSMNDAADGSGDDADTATAANGVGAAVSVGGANPLFFGKGK
ncbi:regulatory protein YycH of two-component signal transduction system YycFG [Paenibacillus endophyticus]|uniref:Regulatory protein YycH of two-component signal transduction system YycFG n=1 Tax=Paenibacillus endophyticus TaxID=1294268 RepID=A0A7W5GAL0_9BACL|nr:two-component system activity regulator YycH [Paenibacillus endophyticus]MBB3152876.1 regulatory protein YycH of two-component signal transduction system YycFG [Paenibacillus endophyticus]